MSSTARVTASTLTASTFVAATLVLTTVTRVGAAAGDPGLLDAVKRRDAATVTALLRQKGNPNEAQADGSSLLHWAAHRSDTAIAALLLKAGARADAANDLGVTPLLIASENGNAELVSLLLANGANPNPVTTAGQTPLMAAARSGATAAVSQLLRRGADPNAAERERHQTALMWAVAAQQPEVVRLLLEAGAKVDARTSSNRRLVYTGYRYITSPPAESSGTVVEVDLGGFTPLLFAAQQGHADIARQLLDAGADRNDQSFLGQTALVIAAHSDNESVVGLLLARGADVDGGDAGFSALHAAALRGNVAMVKALIAARANLNAQVTRGEPVRKYGSEYAITANWKGATPLWLAARFGEHAIVRALLEAGADVAIPAGDGTMPLFAALPPPGAPNSDRRERYRTDVEASRLPPGEEQRLTLETLKVFADRQITLGQTDREGSTLLHFAAQRGFDSVVEFLAGRGVDLNAKNKRGLTPLATAAARRRPAGEATAGSAESSTVTLLRKLGAT